MIKVNSKEIVFEKFPNNETLLKDQFQMSYGENIHIDFKYEDDSDLIKLMLVKKELDNLSKRVSIKILYMPYSRMDRGSDKIIFTLRYISEFIRNLKFDSIVIMEPHSNVCVDLINASDDYFTPFLLADNLKEINPDYILFPDKGAYGRYKSMFKSFDVPIIRADKVRDFSTGKIESLEIIGEISDNATVVIVDDLSSYGGTFLWSASKLKEKGARDIYLIVGHAENSILEGKIPESDLIKKVFTTNSIIDKSKETDKIKITEVI